MNVLQRMWYVRQLKRQFNNWSSSTLAAHQAQRLDLLLDYVRRNSPYYRDILATYVDLESIPPMDKTTMMAHFERINTVGLPCEELVRFKIDLEQKGLTSLYQNQYSIGLSSGTTGSRGLTVLSKKEQSLYNCLLYARSGLPEHIRARRVLFALRTNNTTFMQIRSFGIHLTYVDYTYQVDELIEIINKQDLNILAGPPSLLTMIAKKGDLIKHPIEAVICYGEVLDDTDKFLLEHQFQVPIAQIYQGGEGFIASTCRDGNLHINEDVLLVELVNAGDTIGNAKNIIVTDLYRTTQPVIRYRLDDILELDENPCSCGSCFRVIKRIHGRADEIFFLPSPDNERRYLFPDYVCRSINQSSDSIIEYQAIQHALDLIEIRLVLKSDANSGEVEATIRNNLERWAKKAGGTLGKIEFSYDMPERNPRSQKLIRVIRRI